MSHFDIVRQSNPAKSFRVASVMGTYDLQTEHINERFVGDIDLPDTWNVGLIVGRSGTGKTTIATELFSDKIYRGGRTILMSVCSMICLQMRLCRRYIKRLRL
jgi:ABC-type glutathione transport system ATPase component